MDIQESNAAPGAVEEVARTPATITLLPPAQCFCCVNRGGLTNCARVCHYWNHVCTPLVREVLGTEALSFLMDPISDYTQVKQALAKNALRTRELQLEEIGAFDYAFARNQSSPQRSITILYRDYGLDSAVLTKLRKLSFDIVVDKENGPDRNALIMTMALLKNNPSISTLGIHDQQEDETIRNSVLSCAGLEELSISFPIRPQLAEHVLFQLPKSIRKVSVLVNEHLDSDGGLFHQYDYASSFMWLFGHSN
ncbi:hypothetical protein CPB97_008954 [Podila verticillata]|nr:hypothetical protein CPB97_008954 [Podila verticillata]